VYLRFDTTVEPTMFKGSTMSVLELEQGRQIEHVVRLGHVLRIGTSEVVLAEGSIPGDPGQVYVDCTASGVRATVPRPLFEDGRINLEYVTVGVIPWSASIVGFVEATRDDDGDKNRLCPPVVFSGWSADLLDVARAGMTGMLARGAEPDVAAWSDGARTNPGGGVNDRRDDPMITAALASIAGNVGAAMENFARVLGPADER
jgi:hypothetical protein